jgi:hypothetical protein
MTIMTNRLIFFPTILLYFLSGDRLPLQRQQGRVDGLPDHNPSTNRLPVPLEKYEQIK